jgi:hypothetical protein
MIDMLHLRITRCKLFDYLLAIEVNPSFKNPFKENSKYKTLHLGELAQKLWQQFKPMLEDKLILLSTMKWVNESKAT